MSGDTKTVPPVVGDRFRRRDGTADIVDRAVIRPSGTVVFVGRDGNYSQSGESVEYRSSEFDLIEDLGPAGGEA